MLRVSLSHDNALTTHLMAQALHGEGFNPGVSLANIGRDFGSIQA